MGKRMANGVNTKYCPTCKRTLPATSDFWHKDPKGTFGLYGLCKECDKQREKERRQGYKEKNKEPPWDSSRKKKCPRCERLLPITDKHWRICRARSDGVQTYCKMCQSEVQAVRYLEKNPPKPRTKRWDEYKEPIPWTCSLCGETFPATDKNFTLNKKSAFGLSTWCRECHRRKNREHNRKKFIEDPEHVRARNRKADQKKRQTDAGYRLHKNIQRGVVYSLQKGKQGQAWEELLGYTVEDLKSYLDPLREKGMTWRNYGSKWHVHHRIPVSHFTFRTVEDPEFLQCWSFWNLEPKWGQENQQIGNRVDDPPLPLTH
jgi:hypothetical protein